LLGHLPLLTRPENIIHFFRDIQQAETISKEVLRQRTDDYHLWAEAFAKKSTIPMGSSSPQTNNFTIRQATAGTAVTSGMNSSTYGQPVTFTATIAWRCHSHPRFQRAVTVTVNPF
jgi:hypothetical protein